MRFGTYFFLQAAPGHRHADIIRRELDQMVLSEQLGFDEVWLTEHHFIDYGLSVDPTTLASAVALLDRWGVSRQIYVAPTDAQALAEARDAEMWYQESFPLRGSGLAIRHFSAG